MGSVQVDGFNGQPTKAEFDFEGYNWSKAREVFKTRHKDTEQRHEFLQSQTTGLSVKETCLKLQTESDSKYFKGLGGILSKIDALMKVGDLAIKSAPESVGLAWMGVRMCLHAVQGDFATFQLFSGACADVIGIMISCRVYGKMYGGNEGPEDFQELHSKVVDYIPNIYADILDFSYAVKKYINKHVVIRIGKNMFKDVKGDFQGMMDGIQAHETKMRDFAKIATDRLLVHFQKQGLKNQDAMQTDISFMKEALDANLKANDAFVRHIQILEEERKDMRRKTPYEKAKEEFDENKKTLNPAMDQSDMLIDNIENRRERGTCQWIFGLDEYQRWYNSTDSGVLWVSGAAGYGKSILMSTVIESLQQDNCKSGDAFVQYIFCKTGDDATQTTTRILQTIAFQLYASSESSPSLLEKTNEVFKPAASKKGADHMSSQKKQFNFETIYGRLLTAVDRCVFLIIDAIDECNDREEEHLLQSLRKVVDAAQVKLKVLICSRPEPDIANALQNIPAIKCESHNEADIRTSAIAEMNKFPGWTASEKARACNEIVRKAGGQFRYVQIALEFLRKPLVRPYERAIAKLPDGLSGSYVTSWKQTDPDYVDLLKTTLTWTILAKGKLSVPVIMDAYACTYSPDAGVGEEQEDVFSAEEPTNLHDGQVRIAGGNFLEVTGSRTVNLRHATVKDFFFREEDQSSTSSSTYSAASVTPSEQVFDNPQITHKSDWFVTERQGQLEMMKTIAQNLASPAFQKRYLLDNELIATSSLNSDATYTPEALEKIDNKDEEQQEHELNTDSSEAETESEHEVIATIKPQNGVIPRRDSQHQDEDNAGGNQAQTLLQSDDLLDDSTFYAQYDEEVERNYAAYTLSDQNFRYELVHWDDHLNDVAELWTREERENSIEWNDIWKSLIHFLCKSPDAFRAWQRLKIFDDNSALYTGRADTIYTPLQVAAAMELPALTEILIQEGEDVHQRTTATDEYGWKQSPLEIASDSKSLDLMKVFLEHGADPNSQSNGLTAFHLAVYNNPTCECIQLYLDHGAKLDIIDDYGYNVMHMFSEAVDEPNPDALRLLVSAGADINIADTRGETPLHKLMQRGSISTELLEAYLKEGAKVNIEDNDSQAPLYEAATKGLVEALKLLLAHGANIEDEDNRGVTAVQAAAYAGMLDAVTLLHQSGAVIDRADSSGQTTLYKASKGGSEKTAQYLIDAMKDLPGEQLNRADMNGKTPLRMAAARGSVNTIKSILDKVDAKAAINAQDALMNQSCIHAAAYRGKKAALEMLLEAGGDLSLTDKNGHTPLQVCGQGWTKYNPTCSSDDSEETLLFLIDHDEVLAASCPEVLFAAVMKGSAKVVNRLLDAGADPNSKDEHGWTPLLLAKQIEQHAITDILTKRSGVVRNKPTSWRSPQSAVKILPNGLDLRQSSASAYIYGTVVSNHPIPAGQSRYYYEVEIVSGATNSTENYPAYAVGYITQPAPLTEMYPGDYNPGGQSWGYSEEGFVRTPTGKELYGAGSYRAGDVVGCAVDFDTRTIFYTKNGERHDTASTDVWGRLYPAFGAGGNVVARVNFGDDLRDRPWRWEGCREWLDHK